MIEKLLKSWEEFALSLKRQKGEISWTNLMLDISVQKQHKSKQGHVMHAKHGGSKVNVVTVGHKRKSVARKENTKVKLDHNKAKKPKVNKLCWSCRQGGHWSKDCPAKKAKKSAVEAQDNGIVHEVTPSYTPESNGVAERKNITFKDMINNMLINFGLPKYMWGEALNTDCHILNRVSLKYMDKTPYELWRGKKTSLKFLRVWGFLTKVLVPEHKRKKLGLKTVDCIFLGYIETTTAMRYLVLKSDIDGIVANTIVEFRDATFFENVFPINTGIPQDTSSSSSTPSREEEPRRSKRQKVVKDFGSDFITYNVEDQPLTFPHAMDSTESRHCKE